MAVEEDILKGLAFTVESFCWIFVTVSCKIAYANYFKLINYQEYLAYKPRYQNTKGGGDGKGKRFLKKAHRRLFVREVTGKEKTFHKGRKLMQQKQNKEGNMEMKKLAELFTVAVLIIAFVAPVFAVTNSNTEAVPADSWEYDALTQIASAEDYPDGLGAISRADAAVIIANALPLDMETASGEEVVTLQNLVDEFRQELAYIGVIVNALDDIVHNYP